MAELALKMQADRAVQNNKTLRTLIIPFKGGQAIVPNNLVVEVLPFAPPLGVENAPRWVLGTMLWKAITIPLVSLEYLLAGDKASEAGTHSRIIIVQTIGKHSKLRYFGLVGSEAPRMDELQRSDLALDLHLQAAPTELLNQVLVHGERSVIPDLDAIEAILNRVLSGGKANGR